MFLRSLLSKIPTKYNTKHYHVSLIGASGDVGQTVGLLLRTEAHITKLSIYDTEKENFGVALDLSHIPSSGEIKGYAGDDMYDKAIEDANIILVTGGSFLQPGTCVKDRFSKNSKFIKQLAIKVAKLTPMPIIGIATEPINSIVPMAAEIMRNHGDYDPKKLFGITTVDLLKTQSIYASEKGIDANECFIPVIGGHSARTILPLISQAKPLCDMNENRIQTFTTKVRSCEDVITKAKRGLSPTLCVAYGVLMFTRNILNALNGEKSQVNAFIENNDFGTSFFSGLVNVDKNGAGEMQTYSDLSKYECYLLEKSIEELRKEVMLGKRALEFA